MIGVSAHKLPSLDVLKTKCKNVYTLAPGQGLERDGNHIRHKLGPRALDDTRLVLRGQLLHYILLDFVHLSKGEYCENLLVGPAGFTKEYNAGSDLKQYIQGLDVRDLLSPWCKLMFPRVDPAGDLDLCEAAISNLEEVFGPRQIPKQVV